MSNRHTPPSVADVDRELWQDFVTYANGAPTRESAAAFALEIGNDGRAARYGAGPRDPFTEIYARLARYVPRKGGPTGSTPLPKNQPTGG
jgi:hypothetical protein